MAGTQSPRKMAEGQDDERDAVSTNEVAGACLKLAIRSCRHHRQVIVVLRHGKKDL